MSSSNSAARTHVLIDLDGTISDSHVGLARSLQHGLDSCGYKAPTDDQVRALIGPPFEVSLPTLGVPHDDVERVVNAFRERYDTIGLFENNVYDGVPEMLAKLGAAGYKLAVATSKPEETAVRIIEHFGLGGHFAVQAGATTDVGSHRRTKAGVIAHALEQLDTEPGKHVVMMGDRNHDVEGAIANGIDCIGVTWGFGSRDELHAAGAHTIVNTPRDVVAAVDGSYRAVQ